MGCCAFDAKNPKHSSQNSNQANAGQLVYRALVALQTQTLNAEGDRLELTPGMQVTAEIKLGDETVLEYLLSPVRKAFHEAGRER
jgi:HlyD family secretion protein